MGPLRVRGRRRRDGASVPLLSCGLTEPLSQRVRRSLRLEIGDELLMPDALRGRREPLDHLLGEGSRHRGVVRGIAGSFPMRQGRRTCTHPARGVPSVWPGGTTARLHEADDDLLASGRSDRGAALAEPPPGLGGAYRALGTTQGPSAPSSASLSPAELKKAPVTTAGACDPAWREQGIPLRTVLAQHPLSCKQHDAVWTVGHVATGPPV